MQMGFLNEDLDLSSCHDLAHAAESTWTWMTQEMGDLDDDARREILDLLMEEYIQLNPDKCPGLDSQQTAAINEGAERGRQKLAKPATDRTEGDHQLSQWMLDAMAQADRDASDPSHGEGDNEKQ